MLGLFNVAPVSEGWPLDQPPGEPNSAIKSAVIRSTYRGDHLCIAIIRITRKCFAYTSQAKSLPTGQMGSLCLLITIGGSKGGAINHCTFHAFEHCSKAHCLDMFSRLIDMLLTGQLAR